MNITTAEAKMLRERVHDHATAGELSIEDAVALATELLLAAKEKACKIECSPCEEGEPLIAPVPGKGIAWHHDLGNGMRMRCYASAIRNLDFGDLFEVK